MSDDARGAAAKLMQEALALLDLHNERRAAPHLQLALDLLREAPPTLEPAWQLPTCH
jgi:hypothetical protein